MSAPNIAPNIRVVPMIYAYNTPGVSYHDGWTKIGYTEKQSVQKRIGQQTHTADIRWALAWSDNAMYKDGSGEYFTDHEFHDFLQSQHHILREPKTEWFQIDGPRSEELFRAFARRETSWPEACTYELRKEQAEAVAMTADYFESGGTEFLWNAKPRFGKTLASYDLIEKMELDRVLIVTNRPSIANSWAEDFRKFIGWRDRMAFVSDTDALRGQAGVQTREEYVSALSRGIERGIVAFESLQGLKGSVYLGGQYDKLKWISDMQFDLLIIDEAHEGVDTMRTERAFRNIKRRHTLYLSGTPFKQLASDQFSGEQIYNWSYADEQEAKENWTGDDYNPYEALPRMNMFTYQMSGMIYDQLQLGADLSDDGDTVDFAFDLNEFFATNESGKFVHEAEVRRFLHALTTQEKYPFSTPELRRELAHTLWILNRVASVKALAKLLRDEEFEYAFGDCEIVIAAGDGRESDEDAATAAAYDRVKTAIATHERTITLSVGQLTVGVTIPEWTGVLMLCNLQSPASYMQAAFRAQNPCIFTSGGQRFRKQNSYVFDFDPARTLIIFDEFANNLSPETASGRGTGEDREKNIRRLLNFFPVLGEDEEGKMVELDAKAVLSIPRRLKSQEVVRHGFMSNFLFKNITNIFGAPGIVRQIVEKLTPAQEDPKKNKRDSLDHMGEVPVNDEGEVEIPGAIVIGRTQDVFGPKVYEDMQADIQDSLDSLGAAGPDDIGKRLQDMVTAVKTAVKQKTVEPAADAYDVKPGVRTRVEKQVEREVDASFQKLEDDYRQQTNIARVELERKRQSAESEAEIQKAEDEYSAAIADALKVFTDSAMQQAQRTIEEKPKELVEQLEKHKAESEKRTIEEDVRAHLRGFARTIPSFIMAYGDDELTLANFDDYTEDNVFLDVTGITEDDFRFLRDGGDYTDPETGVTEHFAGHLFDEVVFNDSIREFLKKKRELADYFDESREEDIFDYIPPQKTNQIFTPRWVVVKMVDELEAENPGCFDDPDNTFADLYMKSGLYITEIVKRLYRSEKMRQLFPDDRERIRHILERQVYGMAPTRIIYLIATNYILGFDEDMKKATTHFAQADAAEAAKSSTLQALVDQCFEEQ